MTVLNHNPSMGYRQLGRTGLALSEVALGGHWKNREGGRYWDAFENDDLPADVARNRTEVVSAAIEAGINYLDVTTAAECIAYGAALKGRRDRMYVGADDCLGGARNPGGCTVQRLVQAVDNCLRRLQTDYLDLWRVAAGIDPPNDDDEIAAIVEAAQVLKTAGKIRYFGISAHHRDWLQHVVTQFPAVEVILFPCTARTRPSGSAAGRAEEGILAAARARNVGMIAIKPFLGGSLFKTPAWFPVVTPPIKSEDELARLALRTILGRFDAITSVVAGCTTMHEVENAAKASLPASSSLTPAQVNHLQQALAQQMAGLPARQRWIREWDTL